MRAGRPAAPALNARAHSASAPRPRGRGLAPASVRRAVREARGGECGAERGSNARQASPSTARAGLEGRERGYRRQTRAPDPPAHPPPLLSQPLPPCASLRLPDTEGDVDYDHDRSSTGAAASTADGDAAAAPRLGGRRPAARLTPAHRARISAALRGRRAGTSLPAATREKIAAAAREVNAAPERRAALSAATAGRPKRCSLCGKEGHNRRSCPGEEGGGGDEGGEGDAASAAAAAAPPPPPPSSAYRGVTWSRAHRAWRVQAWDGVTVRFVGVHDDEAGAARAYDAALVAFRGLATARRSLNFPDEVDDGGDGEASVADASAAAAAGATFPLPLSRDEAVAQASSAILRAWRAGDTRLRVDFLVPDADEDGPRARFEAARDLAEATLTLVKADPGLQGRLTPRWLDDEAEPVGAWVGDALAAVLLPGVESVPALEALAAGAPSRLLILFNPSWEDGPARATGALLPSDFGYGAAAATRAAFASSFAVAATTRRLVIGGDDVRVHRVAGGAWQTHYMWPNGRGHLLVAADGDRPSYARVAALLRRVPGSRASRPWTERLGGLGDGGWLRTRERGGGEAEAAVEPPAPTRAAAPPPPTPPPPPSDRFAVDIITGAPVRDVRLDPVLAVARWLGQEGNRGERGGGE